MTEMVDVMEAVRRLRDEGYSSDNRATREGAIQRFLELTGKDRCRRAGWWNRFRFLFRRGADDPTRPDGRDYWPGISTALRRLEKRDV